MRTTRANVTRQGWKGSVKARHLVMAMHDYFSEQNHQAMSPSQETTLDRIQGITDDANQESASEKVEEIAKLAKQRPPIERSPAEIAEAGWALRYVNVFRVQGLIEALDDDVSTFVTVAEANAFTAARPKTWRCAQQPIYVLAAHRCTAFHSGLLTVPSVITVSMRCICDNETQKFFR